MKKAIVGKKIGMTQVFTDDGRLVPVTVVEAGPCKVVQKKNMETDGYSAVQVGFDTYAENRAKKLASRSLQGHFKKANIAPARYLRELKLDNAAELEVGSELTVSQFEAGEKLDVSRHLQGPRIYRHDLPLEPAHRAHGPRLQVSPRRRFAGSLRNACPCFQK